MYRLYWAPDNASLVVRIVFEELALDYETVFVDRQVREQKSAAYGKLNPNGLIPVCLIDGVPVFETGAIVFALAERHGQLAPSINDKRRPDFLKWLFFIANTLHADLRQWFYPHLYVGDNTTARRALNNTINTRLHRHYRILDDAYRTMTTDYLFGDMPSVVDIYLAVCLRWAQLYPSAAPPCPLSRTIILLCARFLRQYNYVQQSPEQFPPKVLFSLFLGTQSPSDGSRGAAL